MLALTLKERGEWEQGSKGMHYLEYVHTYPVTQVVAPEKPMPPPVTTPLVLFDNLI